MAFALRSLFLLCGISALLTGVRSLAKIPQKDNNCPKGWTRLDCFCYIFQSEAREFADAESVCQIIHGNLVSIHSNLENAFVLELIRAGGEEAQSFIGFHDSIMNGDYIWTDGSEQDFLNFDEDASPDPEPNSNTGDCVVMDESDGLWETADCTVAQTYLCITDVLSH
ncbi:galactose-specific lectin nattectin-like [Syngnathoides biaculeatus]|uniref:galactose-specific lectin nattectin-like n=1 Tax=Syngnathoides biaculeatus TaxID=300417 RepID=UPI002ADE60F2|nr:galactose-specific lectin nattectin-like [Syngnathoides biaculeatus]